ncbi:STM4012 family radical SAM protein [Paenibacillus sp. SYP-B4298]|uniref:STM4012 family radical SAM protein n=1 Tax=Paenibacillus sp. SYP-B4298 TaxID=2996034 RepID=UPI0022DD6D98|nr:STM4012 family radical SAM protein [Paenibacillus sp. SYP-B4298]
MADVAREQREAQWLQELKSSPYRSYLYSYPHKTAYQVLEPPIPLSELWREEQAETYFLYMHIPFCAARCGFCNLFTLPDRRADVHEEYVDALERQARQWAELLRGKPFARFAIGGGTPTLLAAQQLERLFYIAQEFMGLDPEQASISVETSPDTVTRERLEVLKRNRVDRVSMGIQSFIEQEAAAIYRPQKPQLVEAALEELAAYSFPLLNLDLIYGLPGQTVDSWLYSVERALAYEPGELFIYPLYTREHTIVKPEQMRSQGQDIRLACYNAARELLLSRGYEQYSMRRFARPIAGTDKRILDYSCQEEGMVGLGCGARSYTREVHYAARYGVSRAATQSIIADYVGASSYLMADYGFVLNAAEQRRRYMLKALLHKEGVEVAGYSARFGSHLLDDLPELNRLTDSGLAALQGGRLALTDEGLAYSDAIGDWLISDAVRRRMEGCVVV